MKLSKELSPALVYGGLLNGKLWRVQRVKYGLTLLTESPIGGVEGSTLTDTVKKMLSCGASVFEFTSAHHFDQWAAGAVADSVLRITAVDDKPAAVYRDVAIKERDDIDRSFRQGKRKKIKTVGKLIEELQQLPPSLKVLGGFDFGVRVTVTNWNDRCLAVQIDEAD